LEVPPSSSPNGERGRGEGPNVKEKYQTSNVKGCKVQSRKYFEIGSFELHLIFRFRVKSVWSLGRAGSLVGW
jgi:hypothetical protein